MATQSYSNFSELQSAGLEFAEATAEIKNTRDISGGRYIKNMKTNQLFTGQFEKSDLDECVNIWRRPKDNVVGSFTNLARAMIRNYHGEVCPIEVILYTSNVVAAEFTNKKLLEDTADVVYKIVRERDYFIKSLEHILKVRWPWKQAINICEIAAGKIAAERNYPEDIQLLRYIHDEFHNQEDFRYGCFYALLLSKKDEFVPDILNVVHDLKYNERDRQLANLFRNYFMKNFPAHLNRLDGQLFFDSNEFVKVLIRKMLSPDNMTEKYLNAASKEEQRKIIDDCLDRILKDKQSMSPFDAINVLKLASLDSVSEQLFLNLGLNVKKPRQYQKHLAVAVIRNYFGHVSYLPALQAFMSVDRNYDCYAAVRHALFYQNKISGDRIIEDFLSENRPDQVRIYIDGFFGFNDRDKDLRKSILFYFNRIPEENFSNAITNYHQLVQKYKRRFFDSDIGNLIKSWFGHKTILKSRSLNVQDQMACIDMIDTIVDEYNYQNYEDFLYYVAEENMDFSPSVANAARKILRKIVSGFRTDR